MQQEGIFCCAFTITHQPKGCYNELMSNRTYRRNTSKTITVNYNPLNGINGTKVFFTVKADKYDTSATDATAIIKQDVTLTANSGVIDLNPSTVGDTVEPGKYYFDMSVLDTAGEIYSIDSGVFTLTAGATNREA